MWEPQGSWREWWTLGGFFLEIIRFPAHTSTQKCLAFSVLLNYEISVERNIFSMDIFSYISEHLKYEELCTRLLTQLILECLRSKMPKYIYEHILYIHFFICLRKQHSWLISWWPNKPRSNVTSLLTHMSCRETQREREFFSDVKLLLWMHWRCHLLAYLCPKPVRFSGWCEQYFRFDKFQHWGQGGNYVVPC